MAAGKSALGLPPIMLLLASAAFVGVAIAITADDPGDVGGWAAMFIVGLLSCVACGATSAHHHSRRLAGSLPLGIAAILAFLVSGMGAAGTLLMALGGVQPH